MEEDGLRELSRMGGGRGTNRGGGCGRRFRPSSTLMELLEEDSYFSRTMELIEHAGLRSMMETSGSFTLFAPRDDAFDMADRTLVGRLYQTPYLMHTQDLIKYHILEDRVCGLELGTEKEFEAANGETLTSSGSSGSYTLNPSHNRDSSQVSLIHPDELASNGVLHALDQLLLPKWVFQEVFNLFEDLSEYSTMHELVVAASMEDIFSDSSGRLTVFAPTNGAFAQLDSSVLQCLRLDPDITTTVLRSHAIDGLQNSETLSDRRNVYGTLQIGVSIAITAGEGLTLNGSTKVVDPDNLAFSGILHGIDSVLLPENFSCGFDQDSVAGTIVGILQEKGFTTLAAMVTSAGLTSFFSDTSASFTLFAPDNAAFDNLSPETLSCLSTYPLALESLLKYHTLGKLYSGTDLETVELVPTEDNGKSMLINGLTAINGLPQVNDAGVTEGDITASNGIIHKISRVVHATGAFCM